MSGIVTPRAAGLPRGVPGAAGRARGRRLGLRLGLGRLPRGAHGDLPGPAGALHLHALQRQTAQVLYPGRYHKHTNHRRGHDYISSHVSIH